MTLRTHDLLFQGIPGVIAATTLESAGEIALIETGPDSCREVLVESLKAHGIAVADIRKVFVTHIHLDHAGGAGWWAQQGANVFVHERGAPHLIEPTRLVESAARIYTDQMQTLWGDILPAPKDKVHPLNDGAVVTVGDCEITAWDTPGHARHHLCYLTKGICFTGDVAGMRLENTTYLSVTSAPPQFEPEAYLTSIDRLLASELRELRLTHYGKVTDVSSHLTRYRQRVADVTALVRHWRDEGRSSSEILQLYEEHERELATGEGITPQQWLQLQSTNATNMCATGITMALARQTART